MVPETQFPLHEKVVSVLTSPTVTFSFPMGSKAFISSFLSLYSL